MCETHYTKKRILSWSVNRKTISIKSNCQLCASESIRNANKLTFFSEIVCLIFPSRFSTAFRASVFNFKSFAKKKICFLTFRAIVSFRSDFFSHLAFVSWVYSISWSFVHHLFSVMASRHSTIQTALPFIIERNTLSESFFFHFFFYRKRFYSTTFTHSSFFLMCKSCKYLFRVCLFQHEESQIGVLHCKFQVFPLFSYRFI